jgi:hypothetical protein
MASTSRTSFRFDELARRVRGDTERRMAAATLQAETEAVAMYSHPGTGRIYGNHQASSPGEPPAPDTGQLRASHISVVETQGHDVVGRVVFNKDYAEPLERGTDKIAPRPALLRALTEGLGRITSAFRRNG